MYDSDDSSFSLVSTADIESICTPTEEGTDEFELLDDPDHEISHSDVSSSCSASLTSSIYSFEFAHGRQYHSYKSGRYPLPNDNFEQHREDLKHEMMLRLTDGRLFYSDLANHPQRIIDIGTGIGSWAIDVADAYPGASVIGTDLSPIQPKMLPTNVQMFVEDCEEPGWMHGEGFDLVHFREMAGFLRDLDSVVATALRNIKHGGWIEFQEVGPQIHCDDGSMEANDPLRLFNDLSAAGMQKLGCSAYGKHDVKRALERAGVSSVQVVMKKIPISTWPKHTDMRVLGWFMKTIILESLEAYAAKPLAALEISPAERDALMVGVKRSLEDNRIHRYVKYYIYYGQKEESV